MESRVIKDYKKKGFTIIHKKIYADNSARHKYQSIKEAGIKIFVTNSLIGKVPVLYIALST